MIEDIKRDRREGSDGPWRKTPDSGEISSKDGAYVARAIGVVSREGGANARRIARVPEMESALMASEGLAVFAALVDASFGGGRVITFSDADIAECKEALAAFRAATGDT